MREESVDGTLSPVSMKGTMDYLDNDLGTARRKVLVNYIDWQSNSLRLGYLTDFTVHTKDI